MDVCFPASPVVPPRYVEACPLSCYDAYVSSVLCFDETAHPPQDNYNSGKSSPATTVSHLSSRRCSSSQKLAKIIHALTPCRGRMARRSHSFGSFPRVQPLGSNREKKETTCRSNASAGTASVEVLKHCSIGNTFKLLRSSWSTKLEVLTSQPSTELHEFRRRWPSSFVTLVTNYLGFLTFTTEEIQQIRDSLIKEAKNMQSCEMSSSNRLTSSPATIRSATPRKLNWSRESKNSEKELEHWYAVVNTVLSYLMEDQRYKHRFILRRPGSHSSMNELERILFPPRHRPLSVSIKNRSTDQSGDDRLQQPASQSDIRDVLRKYDSPVIACLLCRILRRQGCGLIPANLRQIFFQLVDNTKENEAHQLRAVRLLFQLLPRRLLEMVFRPLFELLALIANEPECAVDEKSLAVLFGPVFFLDRATATPTALANPILARTVELLVRLARRELASHDSVSSLFHVPTLFHEDCVQNYESHLNFENPPLSCSLRYCANMTPSPRGKQTDQQSDTARCLTARTAVPKINLTSTFMAKRPRHPSPVTPADYSMPAIKNALLTPPLDFRVRRAANNICCSPFSTHLRSPLSGKSIGSKWSS